MINYIFSIDEYNKIDFNILLVYAQNLIKTEELTA